MELRRKKQERERGKRGEQGRKKEEGKEAKKKVVGKKERREIKNEKKKHFLCVIKSDFFLRHQGKTKGVTVNPPVWSGYSVNKPSPHLAPRRL